MNFISSTTSKSGSKWSCGFIGVKSVTEGGEHELEVGSKPPEAEAVLFKLVLGEDKVTSSKSVGKAPPPGAWPPLLGVASLLHHDGLTSC